MLIPDWKSSWKYLSVHAGIFVVAWGLTPQGYKEGILHLFGIGPQYTTDVVALLGFAVIVGRLLNQNTDPKTPPPST